MKPSTRVIDYVSLIQDGVITIDDVPQDIKVIVQKWVRYFSETEQNGMVEDHSDTQPSQPEVVNNDTNTIN